MSIVNASADEVERQENHFLPFAAFNIQRGIQAFVKIRGVNVHRQDLFIDPLQRFNRSNNTAANPNIYCDESPPAAPVWRPPAKLSTIPGSDPRFIQRCIEVYSALKAF